MQRKLRFAALLIALSALSLAPAVASAGSCSEDCSGECTGGCTIDDPSCGVTCSSNGCSVTCQHVPRDGCTFTSTVSCGGGSVGDLEPATRPLRVLPEPEWTVLQYPLQATEELRAEEVIVVSTSSDVAATAARNEILRRDEEQRRRRGELERSGRWRVEPPAIRRDPFGETLRTHLWVDLAGKATAAALDIRDRSLADAATVPGEIVLRVTTDIDGRIVAASVLHTSSPAVDEALVGWAKRSLRLWSREDAATPIEAFLMLRVGDDRQVGVLLAGARRLL